MLRGKLKFRVRITLFCATWKQRSLRDEVEACVCVEKFCNHDLLDAFWVVIFVVTKYLKMKMYC